MSAFDSDPAGAALSSSSYHALLQPQQFDHDGGYAEQTHGGGFDSEGHGGGADADQGVEDAGDGGDGGGAMDEELAGVLESLRVHDEEAAALQVHDSCLHVVNLKSPILPAVWINPIQSFS